MSVHISSEISCNILIYQNSMYISCLLVALPSILIFSAFYLASKPCLFGLVMERPFCSKIYTFCGRDDLNEPDFHGVCICMCRRECVSYWFWGALRSFTVFHWTAQWIWYNFCVFFVLDLKISLLWWHPPSVCNHGCIYGFHGYFLAIIAGRRCER